MSVVDGWENRSKAVGEEENKFCALLVLASLYGEAWYIEEGAWKAGLMAEVLEANSEEAAVKFSLATVTPSRGDRENDD